jgi:hypothetical protein
MYTLKEIKELEERNAIRLQAEKVRLGAKYLLHPDNFVKKLVKTKIGILN